MNKIKRKYWYTLITIIIMLVIFCFSGQVGEESSQISGWFSEWIAGIPIVGEWITNLTTIIPLRKMAHMFIYFVLGISMNLTVGEYIRTSKGLLWPKKKREIIIVLLSVCFCILYACSDEFHQRFVPGRVGCFLDVMIDGVGVVLSSILVFAIQWNKKVRYGKTDK